jgi:hypothetical protein
VRDPEAMKNAKRIIPSALLMAALANIIVLYRAGDPFRAYLIENADLLYLPTLFSDLIAKGGRIADWFLTPAPYFFPDYPTYLVAYLLGADTYSRIALFSIAQTMLTFFAIWLLARQVSRTDTLTHAVTVTIALIWLALRAGDPFVILFASASHYGIFVSAIFFGALWLNDRSREGHPRARALFLSTVCVLAFLSVLSDTLFIVQVLVPFAATAILVDLAAEDSPMRRRRYPLIAALVLVASVVPALTYRIPIPPPSINVAWSATLDDQQRATLEARFHLTDGNFRGGRLWTYRIADTSRANVRDLVSHRDVQDTEHIDRRSFTVDGTSGPAWRALSTLPVGLGISTIAILGGVFVSDMWSRFRQRLPIRRHLSILMPLASGALGALAYNVVVENPTRYPPSFGLEKAFNNMNDLWVAVERTITDHPAYGVVFISYLALMIVVYAGMGKLIRTSYPPGLAWIAVFSSLSLLSMVVVAGLMTDLPVMPRYLIPVFAWPVVMVVLLVGHHLRKRFFDAATAISTLAVVVMSARAYQQANDNGLGERLYPDEISCVDDALEKEGLRNGIAQYWDAKYFQQFSRLNLNIAQYLENLEEMKWITSSRYFRSRYDFAIISEDAEPTYKISSETLSKLNGAPKQIVMCGNRSLYIYGKDKLRTRP